MGSARHLSSFPCFCNNLFRKAARHGVAIESAEIEASADFPGIGLAATGIQYRGSIQSSASQAAIARLLQETDSVAEVHNTIRIGAPSC